MPATLPERRISKCADMMRAAAGFCGCSPMTVVQDLLEGALARKVSAHLEVFGRKRPAHAAGADLAHFQVSLAADRKMSSC